MAAQPAWFNYSTYPFLRSQATSGEAKLVDHTSGTTVVLKTGDRWYTSPGHKVTLSNPGTVDHVHLFYTMVPTK